MVSVHVFKHIWGHKILTIDETVLHTVCVQEPVGGCISLIVDTTLTGILGGSACAGRSVIWGEEYSLGEGSILFFFWRGSYSSIVDGFINVRIGISDPMLVNPIQCYVLFNFQYYNQSMDICGQVYGQQSLLGSRLYINIGIVYEDNNDYVKAYEYFKRWADTSEIVLGPDHPKTRRAKGVLHEPRYRLVANRIKEQLDANGPDPRSEIDGDQINAEVLDMDNATEDVPEVDLFFPLEHEENDEERHDDGNDDREAGGSDVNHTPQTVLQLVNEIMQHMSSHSQSTGNHGNHGEEDNRLREQTIGCRRTHMGSAFRTSNRDSNSDGVTATTNTNDSNSSSSRPDNSSNPESRRAHMTSCLESLLAQLTEDLRNRLTVPNTGQGSTQSETAATTDTANSNTDSSPAAEGSAATDSQATVSNCNVDSARGDSATGHVQDSNSNVTHKPGNS